MNQSKARGNRTKAKAYSRILLHASIMNPRMQSSDPDEPHDQSKNRGGGKPNEIAQINYNYEPNQLKPSIFLQLQPKIRKHEKLKSKP